MRKILICSIITLLCFNFLAFSKSNYLIVNKIIGSVEYKKNLLEQWQNLNIGMNIENEYKIKLLNNSFCAINYFQNIIKINQLSMIRFNYEKNLNIDLYTGEIYFKINDINEIFTINTPNRISITINKPCEFTTLVDNNGVLAIKVFDGQVDLPLKEKKVSIEKGKYIIIKNINDEGKNIGDLSEEYFPEWIKF